MMKMIVVAIAQADVVAAAVMTMMKMIVVAIVVVAPIKNVMNMVALPVKEASLFRLNNHIKMVI
jgi:hypothetical protein